MLELHPAALPAAREVGVNTRRHHERPYAAPETHEWVGIRCGIVTPYVSTGGEELREGEEDDCLMCDAPVERACLAVVRRKEPQT